MTTATPTSSARARRRPARALPRGEDVKVVLALVLNTILFALLVL